MPKKTILAVVSLVLIFGVFAYFRETHRETNTSKIMASGTIEATEIDVAAEVSGKLVSLEVYEGQMVEAGDILAKIDSRAFDLQVLQQEAVLAANQSKATETISGTRQEIIDQAKATVKQSGATVVAARNSLDNATDNYNRIKSLFEKGAATNQQLDNAELQLLTAQAQLQGFIASKEAADKQLSLLENGSTTHSINSSQASVSQAQASLELAKLQRSKTIILSPVKGIVNTVSAEKGEFLSIGANIITVLDPTDLWVKVYIPETDIPNIKIGQKVSIFIDAFPDKPFVGQVVQIASKAEFTPKNLQTKKERVKTVFGVKIKISSESEQLKPGLPADIEIKL